MNPVDFLPPGSPGRCVVLGARGFIGRALVSALAGDGRECLGLGSAEIDLATAGAGDALAERLRPDDTLVVLSALTPDRGRGVDAFLTNIGMATAICAALSRQPVAHVVYVSSDAVYPLSSTPEEVTHEDSPAAPGDLYGAAHRSRELMLAAACGPKLLVLRPTLIFGAGDSHNAYGATRFLRQARTDGRISLFGGGEETRDHVWVQDLARLIAVLVRRRAVGTLNAVTGQSVTYARLATLVCDVVGSEVAVEQVPRKNPLTYRTFDRSALASALPEFAWTPLEDALLRTFDRMVAGDDSG